jgi:putative ABC transport system permease protein
MWKNYFKIAIRNIKKNGLRSFIHVVGLSIGIAACFVIYNLARYEYSFDNFHEEDEKIHRFGTITNWYEESWPNPGVPFPLAEAAKEEIKPIESITHFYTFGGLHVSEADSESSYGRQNNIVFVEPGYFNMFSYEWLTDKPIQPLADMYDLVLTEKAVNRYFGDISPQQALGRSLVYEDTITATVRGVVKDFNKPSDLIFTDFLSLSYFKENESAKKRVSAENWSNVSSSSQVFAKFDPAYTDQVKSDLAVIAEKYIEEEEGSSTEFTIEPLSEVHFTSTFGGPSASKYVLNGLMVIGFFILLIACINFINLETAQSNLRSKEVGIRKTLGGRRDQLVKQFLTETYVIIVSALFVGILLCELSLIYFEDLLPYHFQLEYISWSNLFFVVGVSLVVLLLSGFYPALVLSGFTPLKALKSGRKTKKGFDFHYFVRKNLTVFQFGLSITFIIGILVISKQINYMLDKDLGFDYEEIAYNNTPFNDNSGRINVLKNELSNKSYVSGVSLSTDILISGGLSTSSIEFVKEGSKYEESVQVKMADTSYLDVYNVPLLAGRMYRDSSNEFVVNENCMKMLGYNDPVEAIGNVVSYGDEEYKVVGVFKNVHTRSFYEEIRPMVIYSLPSERLYRVNVKLQEGSDHKAALADLQATYKKVYPDETFKFEYLSELVENFYQSVMLIRKVLGFATVITILISCLGLFGLTSFTIAQRTKEISIRKVLGASVQNILMLISKEYALLIAIAFTLSIYPAWYLMNVWLQSFHYRIDISVFFFVIAGAIAFSVSIGIVVIHSLRAIRANPADVLKDE